ncbi:MAG: ATPase, partial [Chloroflexota bacterium]|nr:ATPase [Chloroflexota bacterium]
MTRANAPASVLAVDGGNSKTDVALVAHDGMLLGAVRGPTVSHEALGLEAGVERLTSLVMRVRREAGLEG